MGGCNQKRENTCCKPWYVVMLPKLLEQKVPMNVFANVYKLITIHNNNFIYNLFSCNWLKFDVNQSYYSIICTSNILKSIHGKYVLMNIIKYFFLSNEKTYSSTFIARGDKIFLCLSSFSWIHIVVDGWLEILGLVRFQLLAYLRY